MLRSISGGKQGAFNWENHMIDSDAQDQTAPKGIWTAPVVQHLGAIEEATMPSSSTPINDGFGPNTGPPS
ncbi:hypothetical protein [Sphingomonas sp.]|uniref:hypothetical protein n=1 Tax=Sphingomonas sp. TaxID=28214 RepID=UPI002602D4C0|nr:hypothetical protein [Sphingomonas sp.]MDK2767104.1 hypothetical protein [Sphingomonas sp.]